MSRSYTSLSSAVFAFLLAAAGGAFAASDGASERNRNAERRSDVAPDEDELEREHDEYVRSLTVTKAFLVVGTFRSHASALRAMRAVAKRTGVEAPEPDSVALPDGELTLSRDVCEENGWDHPCYVARGRWDDGTYLSIEPSSAYEGMVPGYFVLIGASGLPGEVAVAVRKLRMRGYVRTSTVWMGCIH